MVGACAMTTNFLDNKICTLKILLSWRFPRKNSVFDNFPFFIVVSPPLIWGRVLRRGSAMGFTVEKGSEKGPVTVLIVRVRADLYERSIWKSWPDLTFTIANPPAPYRKKMPWTQKLSKICPDDCFSGFQSWGPKFVKNLSKNWESILSGQICQNSDKLLTTLRAQRLKKIQDLEISKRDWKVQASHPPNPYFLWEILEVGIENFNRDWNLQARLKISSENLKFSSVQARLIFFQDSGPPTLVFFWKKQGFFPKEARVSLFAEPLKSLENPVNPNLAN